MFPDPDWVLEQVALAPSQFTVRARNPERDLRIGGDSMVLSAVYGPPFLREGAHRRDATFGDFERLVQLSQHYDQIDTPGGVICEPNDLPLDLRGAAQPPTQFSLTLNLTTVVPGGCPGLRGS